ncbi:MAG TPA: hypothetical protein PLV82_03160 [bacterium]|nr:hypothetical protein [bacterium]
MTLGNIKSSGVSQSYATDYDKINMNIEAIAKLRAEVSLSYDKIENDTNLSEAGKEAEEVKIYSRSKKLYDRLRDEIETTRDAVRADLINKIKRHPKTYYGVQPSIEETAEMRSLIDKADKAYSQDDTREFNRLQKLAIDTGDKAMIRALGFVAYRAGNSALLAPLSEHDSTVKALYEFEVEQGIFRSREDLIGERIQLTGIKKPPRASQETLNQLF